MVQVKALSRTFLTKKSLSEDKDSSISLLATIVIGIRIATFWSRGRVTAVFVVTAIDL